MLKLFLEGAYNPGTNSMNYVNPIFANVFLHNAETGQLVASQTVMVTALGHANTTISYPHPVFVTVVVNGYIRTQSASAVDCSNGIDYDFTTSATMAYGDNQVELAPGVFGFYGGDFNGDGNIDNSDYSIWEEGNNSSTPIQASHVADLNNDGLVDNADYEIWERNSNNFVSEQLSVTGGLYRAK